MTSRVSTMERDNKPSADGQVWYFQKSDCSHSASKHHTHSLSVVARKVTSAESVSKQSAQENTKETGGNFI